MFFKGLIYTKVLQQETSIQQMMKTKLWIMVWDYEIDDIVCWMES